MRSSNPPPEQHTDVKLPTKEKKSAPIEQIAKLEKEMNQVQESNKDANLALAKSYLTKLLTNEAVKNYIARHQPEILSYLELAVNTTSMEEAMQVSDQQ
jgi:hypothetical protein